MANGSNIGLGLADILAKTSSTAPNMLQRAGAVLQGKPDPMTEFQNQDFARRVTLAQLLRQEKQAKREDIKFEREEDAIKEFQEAATIFGKDPIGALSKMAAAGVKAGDKDISFKAFELAEKIRKDKTLQEQFTSYRTRIDAARTPEERRQITVDLATQTGSKELLELVGKQLDVEVKARQLEAPQGAPNRLALDAIRKGETLPNLTMEQTQQLAGLSPEPLNQQAAKAVAQKKSLPGFTLEETKRMAGAREGTDKPLSLKDKQQVAGQIMGEARRQVEAQFRGILGQLDLSSLGKTPEQRAKKFQGMIQQAAKELAEERGFSLEDLKSTKPQTTTPTQRVTPQVAREELIKAINRGDIVDTAAAEQFLIDRGLPASNARYIVNQMKAGK